jgi:hypothetical protein
VKKNALQIVQIDSKNVNDQEVLNDRVWENINFNGIESVKMVSELKRLKEQLEIDIKVKKSQIEQIKKYLKEVR